MSYKICEKKKIVQSLCARKKKRKKKRDHAPEIPPPPPLRLFLMVRPLAKWPSLTLGGCFHGGRKILEGGSS